MFSSAIVAITLQHTSVSRQHLIHLKLTQGYISVKIRIHFETPPNQFGHKLTRDAFVPLNVTVRSGIKLQAQPPRPRHHPGRSADLREFPWLLVFALFQLNWGRTQSSVYPFHLLVHSSSRWTGTGLLIRTPLLHSRSWAATPCLLPISWVGPWNA